MHSRDGRPAWWQLYLLVPVMIGLLVLQARAPFSELGHEAATIGVLLLVYALIGLWLRANERALLRGPVEKVARREWGQESLQVWVPWTPPPETRMARNGNGDRDPGQAALAVSATMEMAKGGNGDHDPSQVAESVSEPVKREEG
jgi:hypothetical protein